MTLNSWVTVIRQIWFKRRMQAARMGCCSQAETVGSNTLSVQGTQKCVILFISHFILKCYNDTQPSSKQKKMGYYSQVETAESNTASLWLMLSCVFFGHFQPCIVKCSMTLNPWVTALISPSRSVWASRTERCSQAGTAESNIWTFWHPGQVNISMLVCLFWHF